MHDAVRKIQAFIAPLGQARAESVEGVEPLALAEVALRWLVCHSKLREGDGVILGGSRTAQIERNKGVVGKGKLDEGLVECVEGVWVGVRREG